MALGFALAASAQVGTSIDCLPGITPAVPVFNPASTVGVVADYTIFCTNTGFNGAGPVASENFDFFMNVTELNTGAWTLTQASNTYTGTLAASNQVEFLGVAYDTNRPTLSFELHGVKVNPSLWGPGFVFREDATIAGLVTPLFSSSPDLVVGLNSPEPGTLALVGMALLLLSQRRHRVDPTGPSRR